MNRDELLVQVKNCAAFFYQNEEQEAYLILNNLLPHINEMLQTIAMSSVEYQNAVVMILRNLLEAYQVKDHLALADILEYEIANIIMLGEGNV